MSVTKNDSAVFVKWLLSSSVAPKFFNSVYFPDFSNDKAFFLVPTLLVVSHPVSVCTAGSIFIISSDNVDKTSWTAVYRSHCFQPIILSNHCLSIKFGDYIARPQIYPNPGNSPTHSLVLSFFPFTWLLFWHPSFGGPCHLPPLLRRSEWYSSALPDGSVCCDVLLTPLLWRCHLPPLLRRSEWFCSVLPDGSGCLTCGDPFGGCVSRLPGAPFAFHCLVVIAVWATCDSISGLFVSFICI